MIEVVDHRRDLLARGQRIRLSGVLGLQPDELVGARLDGVGEPEQRLLPVARCGVAPGLEGLGRRAVGGVDVLRRRDGCGGHDLAGRRIDDVAARVRHGVDVPTVDEVAQDAGRGLAHDRCPSSRTPQPRTGGTPTRSGEVDDM
jgi:hypothetical protein